MELPKFLSQDNYDEKYPKFEVTYQIVLIV